MSQPKPWKLIRIEKFEPYREGLGPVFHLAVLDVGANSMWTAQDGIAYQLFQDDDLVFEGRLTLAADQVPESDSLVRDTLLRLTTGEVGNDDNNPVDDFTPAQQAFWVHHAEALHDVVVQRFSQGRSSPKIV